MLTVIMEHLEELVAVLLFAIGFTTLLLNRNIIKKIIGFNIMDTAIYLFLAEKGYNLLPEYTDVQSGFKPLSRKETNYAVHDMAQFFLFAHTCRTSLATGSADSGSTQMLRDLQIELRELEEKDDISFEEFQKLQNIKKSIKKLQESGNEEIFPVAFLRFLPEPLRSTLKDGIFTAELYFVTAIS